MIQKIKSYILKNKIEASFIALILFAFIFSVVFNLTTSSSSIWSGILKEDNKGNTIVGTPKGIRSDEWLVSTPFILSQSKNDYKVENPNIGEGKSTLLMNIPIKHWSTLLRPQHWGFFIFGTERGFAFFWNFKYLILILSSFFLFKLLTKNNILLSIFGSLWILFSSFTQWWFSTNISEIIGYSFLSLIFSLYLFQSAGKKKTKLLYLLLTILSIFNFVILFYPAFQVPLILLDVFIFFGYLLKKYNYKDFMLKVRENYIYFLIVVLISTFFVLIYFFEARSVITIIINTVYPGKRISNGGDSLWLYGVGFFNNFINSNNITPRLGNFSEASNYINLGFVIVLLIFFSGINKIKENLDIFIYSIFYIFMFLWTAIGFPSILSKITLLSFTTPNRAQIAIGISSIILVVVFLSKEFKYNLHKKLIIFLLSAIYLFLVIQSFFSKTNLILQKEFLLLILVFLALSIYFLIQKKSIFLIILLSLFLLQNIKVNPIIYGLGELNNSLPINFKEGIWLGSEIIYPAYLKAQGADVINGVNYTPRFETWRILDPSESKKDIYNRYAHVSYVFNNENQINIKLVQADLVSVDIDPCMPEIKEIGITNIAINGEIQSECLILEKAFNKINFYKIR